MNEQPRPRREATGPSQGPRTPQEGTSPTRKTPEGPDRKEVFGALPGNLEPAAQEVAAELQSDGLDVRVTRLSSRSDRLGPVQKLARSKGLRPFMIKGSTYGIKVFTSIIELATEQAKDKLKKHPKTTLTAVAGTVAFTAAAIKLIEKRRQGKQLDENPRPRYPIE